MPAETKVHFTPTTRYKLIYVFCVHDDDHDGMLKIGDASVQSSLSPNELPNNCAILNKAAKDRIKQYSTTLGISPHLLHTEIATLTAKDEFGITYVDSFRDYDVHRVLLRSGIEKASLNGTGANEWYRTDLETAKNAISAVKLGKKQLTGNEITSIKDIEIILREEQEEAIRKTIRIFKTEDQMLWNAKMRYGKTVTALSFIKRQLDKYKKTLIITHRPVVESGWREDFNLIFKNEECTFESKDRELDSDGIEPIIDRTNELHLTELSHKDKPFIYFASIQDLRGSRQAGGRYEKNAAVFDMDWDLIINDEAHEGTQTELGIRVASLIKKKRTKLLSLSGTPFNIISQYDDDAIYTWDYVMEQSKKEEWDKTHPGDPNPYAAMPKMHIYTYDLGYLIHGFTTELENKAFNFSEFFRTWTGDPQKDGSEISQEDVGEFVHKKDIIKFLDLITVDSKESAYPYSTDEYKDMFRHSLWMVPGVKEAKALSKILHNHPIFRHFGIANVAGEGDDYEETHTQDALKLVNEVIHNNEFSITLSCGKLTTGVTIRQWTACFMLSGSYTTSASNYLQTIFRVQSPGSIKGKVKEHCYVFDFAPDRTLRVIAEAARVSRKGGSGGTTGDEANRRIMTNFLNYCSVISITGSTMKPYSVNSMMQQIKHIYAERAINTGFEDSSIYNERLMTLDKLDLADFNELKKIIGSTKATQPQGDIVLNEQGFTEEEYETIKQLKKKEKKKLTPEEKAALEELKKQKEEKEKAISILRGVSIRMPLLIFGADVPLSEEITIERFVDIIDEKSWDEFMPAQVSKELFKKFIKYYDKDVFIAAAKEIRLRTKRADNLLPTERIQHIAMIHSKFKNPDKETVLTPWRVVNMHLSDCLGGYCFYNEGFDEDNQLDTPRFVNQNEITEKTFLNPHALILEINSKTGLYPLFAVYSIYRAKCKDYENRNPEIRITPELQQKLWAETVSENMYVICKTPMAKAITIRTLVGYKDIKVNAHSFENLINQFKNKSVPFITKITRGSFWGKEAKQMKFNAIIGNPPYMEMDNGNKNSASPVYQHFVLGAKYLKPDYISMIMPSRWFIGGKGLDDFREQMLNDKHIRSITDYADFHDVFPSVDLAGGVSYFLWDSKYNGPCTFDNVDKNEHNRAVRDINEFDILIRDNKAVPIVRKIIQATRNGPGFLSPVVSPRKPFALPTNYNERNEGIPCYFTQKIGFKFADPHDVDDSLHILNKWKFLAPRTPIAGQTDFTKPVGFYYNGNTIIAKPGECCTETWIVLNSFDTMQECEYFKSYIMTKIARFLLLQSVISQDVTRENFRFVPDLGTYSEMYSDEILCDRWGITKEEYEYIDSRIHNYENQQR